MNNVGEESLEHALSAFRAYDKNDGGWVSGDDFKRVVLGRGMEKIIGKDVDVEAMLADADRLSTGKVLLTDYIMLISRRILTLAEPDLITAFKAFEAKGESNAVPSATLLHVLTATGSQLDRASKDQVATACQFPLTEPINVKYKHILQVEADRQETTHLKEKVFSESDADG